MHFQREPEMEFLLSTLCFCNYRLPSSLQVLEEVFLLCSLNDTLLSERRLLQRHGIGRAATR
jgi:hypothetical protein